MNETISDKYRKVRKPTRCEPCGLIYPIGTSMMKLVGKFEGDFFATNWCACCDAFWKTLPHDEQEEGLGRGDMWNFQEYKKFAEQFKQAYTGTSTF